MARKLKPKDAKPFVSDKGKGGVPNSNKRMKRAKKGAALGSGEVGKRSLGKKRVGKRGIEE